jgi:PAS domain S-box-containing protein
VTTLTAPTGERRTTTKSLRAALRRASEDLPKLGRLAVGPRAGVGIGLLVGTAAIFVKAGLNLVIGGETGFIILTGAVAISAWIGGLSGGLTATVIAGIANSAIFVGLDGTHFAFTPIDIIRLILYMAGGAVVSVLMASLRSSRDRLALTLEEVGSMAADLERRDERLELVLAASATGFWEWDVQTGDLLWSETIFRQHGLDPTVGSPSYARYIETLHPDDRPAFQAAIDAALAGGSPLDLQFRLVWADGSIHWTHGVGRVFRDAHGDPIRMVGTGQDITEARRLEAERDQLLLDERRAGAFREAFLDVISHELRTPITTILGLTQILSKPGRVTTPEEQAGLIDDISQESERLHRLVEDLLVLTRAERGEFAIESEPLELRRLLSRVVERESLRLPTIVIEAEIPRDLPVVAGEDIYVEQIVRNMLGNAAKYTPVGTHVIVRAEAEGDDVAIRVLDSGPGIDEAAATRAFELFYRDPSRARSVAGSGIGLFVCASLVEAMGGIIWARQRTDGGSEFGFTLRGLPDDEASAAQLPAGITAAV